MKKINRCIFVSVATLLAVINVGQMVRAQSRVAPFECAGCYLRGIDISVEKDLGRDLSGAVLRGADLRGANLSNIAFVGADFSGADLRDAILNGTFFTSGASLRGADLRGAKMNGTFFTNSDLRNADLREVSFFDGSLEGANLVGAKIDPGFESRVFLCKTIMPDGRIRNDDCP